MWIMKKHEAISLLGGSIPKVAAALKVSYQAVNQWPEDLPNRISQRVLGAWLEQNPQHLPELTKEVVCDQS